MPSSNPTPSQASTPNSRNGSATSSAAEKPTGVATVKKVSATNAAKPAPAKKSAASTAAAEKPSRTAPAKKAAPKKKVSTFEAPAEAEWHRLISEAAYHRAEKRGFAPGHEHEDWVWAEEHVRKILSP